MAVRTTASKREGRFESQQSSLVTVCGSEREHSSEPETGVKGNAGRKARPFHA